MISHTHPSWHKILESAFSSLDPEYISFLENNKNYFPDINNLFNAFKLPLEDTKYILFGQDPYPRYESAIGYAFIDGKVKDIFCKDGLTKEVNKATSLRNFIKMAFVCEGELKDDLSKKAVAKIDKAPYIKTISDLKNNFEKNGVLLLNMALIFTTKEDSKHHVKSWLPFIKTLLSKLQNEDIKLILFGKMAEVLQKVDEASSFTKHTMPHPYNLNFIDDKEAHELFKPMRLICYQPHD